MRWEGILDTVKPGAIILDTFPSIPVKIIKFKKDLEGDFLDFPLVYESLVKGSEIMYVVGSQVLKPFFSFSF